MKRHPAILLLLLMFSAAAHPVMFRPGARSGDDLQETAPPQVNPPSPPVEVPPKQVGGAVSAPVLVKKVEAKFTDAGRKAKVNGAVLVGIIVETDGIPSHVHIIKSLGYGLDETAVAAITQYRFKPAMQDGKPVPVEVNVEVHFRIYGGRFHF